MHDVNRDQLRLRPVIFLHLQKTAGTAFRHYLETTLPAEERLLSLGNEDEARRALASYANLTDAQRSQLRVIFGHEAKQFYPHYPSAPLVTFLRDPFDRAMSQYLYERRNAFSLGLQLEERPEPNEVPLPEFMARFLRWGESDHFQLQSRTIADFFDIDVRQLSVDDMAGLLDRFDFVGTQDQFALSAFMFHRRYDLPSAPIPFVNSYSGLTKQFFPKSFIRDVCAASPLDAKLFEIASERLEDEALTRLSDKTEWGRWQSYLKQTERTIRRHMVGSSARFHETMVPAKQAVALADSVTSNIAAISVPPGTWDISGMAAFAGGPDTLVRYVVASLSSEPAQLDSTPGRRADIFYSTTKSAPIFQNGNQPTIGFPLTRVSVTEATMFYLVALAEFGSGPASAFGMVSARKA